jgi:hypothetical protein
LTSCQSFARPRGSRIRKPTIAAPKIASRVATLIAPPKMPRATVDRAGDRPESADDDHREVLDRHEDVELLRAHHCVVMRLERAGHPNDERRHREREDLVAHEIDAHDRGGDVLVPDRDERAPDAGAEQVRRSDDGERERRESKEVVGALVVEDERAERRRGDAEDPLAAAGDRDKMHDEPLDHNLRCQCCDD